MDFTTQAGPALLRRRGRPAGHATRGGDVLVPHGGGAGLVVRPVDTADLGAVTALHRRCSVGTLEERYRGPAAEADGYLRHLLAPRFGRSLAAWSAHGTVVGLGHLLWDGDEAEVALLVADSWQRRGVGAGLLRRLADTAGELGLTCLYAVAQPPGTGMAAVLRSLGRPLEFRHEEDAVVITTRPAPPPPWTDRQRPDPQRPGPPRPGPRCVIR